MDEGPSIGFSFELQRSLYVPGEVVFGVLRVVVHQPLTVSSMRIEFCGRHTRPPASMSIFHTTTLSVYNTTTKAQPGSYTYPFTLILPDIPPSCSIPAKGLNVEYYLRAVAHAPSGGEETGPTKVVIGQQQHAVQVGRVISRGGLGRTSRINVACPRPFPLCCLTRKIEVEVSIPSDVIMIGRESIRVTVHCKGLSTSSTLYCVTTTVQLNYSDSGGSFMSEIAQKSQMDASHPYTDDVVIPRNVVPSFSPIDCSNSSRLSGSSGSSTSFNANTYNPSYAPTPRGPPSEVGGYTSSCVLTVYIGIDKNSGATIDLPISLVHRYAPLLAGTPEGSPMVHGAQYQYTPYVHPPNAQPLLKGSAVVEYKPWCKVEREEGEEANQEIPVYNPPDPMTGIRAASATPRSGSVVGTPRRGSMSPKALRKHAHTVTATSNHEITQPLLLDDQL